MTKWKQNIVVKLLSETLNLEKSTYFTIYFSSKSDKYSIIIELMKIKFNCNQILQIWKFLIFFKIQEITQNRTTHAKTVKTRMRAKLSWKTNSSNRKSWFFSVENFRFFHKICIYVWLNYRYSCDISTEFHFQNFKTRNLPNYKCQSEF